MCVQDLASLLKALYDAVGSSIRLPPNGAKTLKLRLTVGQDRTQVHTLTTSKPLAGGKRKENRSDRRFVAYLLSPSFPPHLLFFVSSPLLSVCKRSLFSVCRQIMSVPLYTVSSSRLCFLFLAQIVLFLTLCCYFICCLMSNYLLFSIAFLSFFI